MINNEATRKNWFSKHADTVIVLTAVLGAFFWMTSQIRGVEERGNVRFSAIEKNISAIEKDIAIIKTVLIMKETMPKEFASLEKK